MANSTTSSEAAGWRPQGTPRGNWPARLRLRRDRRWSEFSWLTTRALLDSVNDTIAKSIDDLVNARRMQWVSAMRAAGALERWPDWSVDLQLPPAFSCLVLGDPGEADGSQYAVAEAIMSQADGTQFMLIMSDVIYPAGDVNDYANGFYLPFNPYRRRGFASDRVPGSPERPILALPGNHDWYDGLGGFMFHFCGAEPLPPSEYRSSSFRVAERLARRLWVRASRPDRTRLLSMRDGGQLPGDPPWQPRQPGPYFTIDSQDLRLVCIDTGITGTIDEEQGHWLRRVSADPRKKVLLTGKPLLVDGESVDHEGVIDWGLDVPADGGTTVDAIVRHPDNRYVATIGGDIHNYQHYEVALTQPDRTLHYVVAGGAGAYMAASHTFEPIPELVTTYPSRGDSVAFYARHYMRTIRRWAVASLLALGAAVAVVVTGNAGHVVDGAAPAGRTIGDIAAVTGVTVAALVIVVGLAAIVGRLAPSGYRFLTGVSLAAVLTGLAVAVLAAFWDPWSAVWPIVLEAVGAVVVPLVLVVAAYFFQGYTPHFTVDLLVCGGILGAAGVWIGTEVHPSGPGIVLMVATGVALLAGMVLGLHALLDGHGEPPWRDSRWYRWPLYAVLLAGVVGLMLVADHWLLWAAAIAFASLLVLVALAFWLVLVRVKGLLALIASLGPAPDPDELYGLYATGTPRAAGAPAAGWRARRLADFVTSSPNKQAKMSEIGDANEPPMFKSFLGLEVTAAKKLVITCFGVTGWGVDAADPPVEERIEIQL